MWSHYIPSEVIGELPTIIMHLTTFTRTSRLVYVNVRHSFIMLHLIRSGSVLCVAVSLSGEICFSGSADSNIGVWQLPGDLSDPFDVYGKT